MTQRVTIAPDLAVLLSGSRELCKESKKLREQSVRARGRARELIAESRRYRRQLREHRDERGPAA